MKSSDKYYIPSVDMLFSHCWNDQCAVYHSGSGDTHLLNKIDLLVLQGIGEQAVTSHGLCLKFANMFDDDPGDYIKALLDGFEALGLVSLVGGKINP